MKEFFIALQLLFLIGSFPLSDALPAGKIMDSGSSGADHKTSNVTILSDISAETTVAVEETTDDPVSSLTPEQIPSSPEEKGLETTTGEYTFIEQEEDDEDDDTSTISSDSVKTTHPMQSPQSTPVEEEVLRELKKLWDISEGLSDSEHSPLKTSLSSIVHLAYARLYTEPDETLLKLKYLLQQLQVSLLGTETHSVDAENHSATKLATEMLSSSPSHHESNYATSTTTNSPTNQVTVTLSTSPSISTGSGPIEARRKKRSFNNDYETSNDDDDVRTIFFANVNSAENSVVSDEKSNDEHQKQQEVSGNASQDENIKESSIAALSHNNATDNVPLHRTILTVSLAPASVLPISSSYQSTTPSSVVQKVIRINDRRKPLVAPPFFLSPERIHELKSKVTSTTPYNELMPSSTVAMSALSPISVAIKDELENEVNTLQQQNVDHYDVHIVPLSTTPSPLSLSTVNAFHGASITSRPIPSSTEFPHTAEEIALALFQLLRPDSEDVGEEDEGSVTLPHPTPSNILYQVNSLSSVLNFISGNMANTTVTSDKANVSTISAAPPSFLSVLNNKNQVSVHNNTSLLAPPTLLSDFVFSATTASSTTTKTTTTEEQSIPHDNMQDYTEIIEQEVPPEIPGLSTALIEDTKDNLQNMVSAVTRLSVGAKIVLLFSVSISLLSIGFGVYALGPPLAAVGVLGIVIPIALLILFENNATAGKRKLTTRQRQQLLVGKLQSAEFSKLLDLVLDSIVKYKKG